jgi:hypothetical protein
MGKGGARCAQQVCTSCPRSVPLAANYGTLQQYTSVPTIEHLEEEGGIELEVRKVHPDDSGDFEETVVNVAKRARAATYLFCGPSPCGAGPP